MKTTELAAAAAVVVVLYASVVGRQEQEPVNHSNHLHRHHP
jgi:hypothetical protein